MENTDLEKINKYRKHVLVLGAAGTGKTYLINQMAVASSEDVLYVAMTATAASQMRDGMFANAPMKAITLYSFMKHYMTRPRTRFQHVIIDEVSMVSDSKMDQLLIHDGRRRYVFVGDIYQVAPIQGSYFWYSDRFKKIMDRHDLLVIQRTHNFRYGEDSEYMSFAEDIRNVRFSPHVDSIFQRLSTTQPPTDNYKEFQKKFKDTTFVVGRYTDADYYNRPNLSFNSGDPIIIRENNYDQEIYNGMCGTYISESTIEINGEKIHVNAGDHKPVVKRFKREKGIYKTKIYGKKTTVKRARVLYTRCHALICDHIQGMTFSVDRTIVIDLKSIWNINQLYVNLTRCKKLSQLKFINYNPEKIQKLFKHNRFIKEFESILATY